MTSGRACPRCNAGVPEDAGFCDSCGAALTRACPSCGAAVALGESFCGTCGAPVAATPAAPAPAAASPVNWRAFLLPGAALGAGALVVAGGLFLFLGGDSDDDDSSATAPTDSSVSTPTLDVSSAFTPTPIVDTFPMDTPPSSTYPSGWAVVFSDTFDTNVNDWPVGEFSETQAVRTRELAGGVYSFSLTSQQGWVAPDFVAVSVGTDYYVAADVTRTEASGTGAVCGIAVASESTYPRLALLIDDLAGAFRVYRVTEQGATAENLVNLTPSPAVLGGGTNRLAILSDGGLLTFFINDEVVGEVADSPLGLASQVGLVTGTWDVAGTVTCLFDNLEVRAP